MLCPSRRTVCLLLGCIVVLAAVVPAAGEFENPKAKSPPRAKPQRRSAAESIPPLPLPATPLRRSERKRQPAPPALVGMINFSQTFKIVDGKRLADDAFPTTRIDIERLMNHANRRLNIRYRYVPTSLEKFSWDPAELPLLYLTGWTPMPRLSDEMTARLGRYLYDGGTLILHSQCGRREFGDSAREQIRRLLPGRRLARVDSDSPLFGAYYDITRMRVRKDAEPFMTKSPFLEAVYLGCRPAIIFSPIDLNCGWDVARRPIKGGILYHQDDAIKLGVNIVTTMLANLQYARAWGTKKVYHQQDDKTRDRLVIAQVRHGGDYDPTPHALVNLMKYIQKNTTINVQFKRQLVEPSDAAVFEYPVLYMTGLKDFVFSDAEIARLRSYLAGGGMLVADAAAGRKAFDRAFRREIKRVLPNSELKTLRPDSPVYKMPYRILTVDYTDMVKAQNPALNAPSLEGITIDGQLGVIYSALSLSNGWEQIGFAYNRGYADSDALRLGVNVFCYALTH